MRQTTPQTRSLMFTVSIGSLVLLYAFLVFVPTRKGIGKMRSELDEKRQLIVEAQQDFTHIGAIQQDLDQTRQWVAAWKENSPKRQHLGGFFSRIAEISRASGIRVERITPAEPAELRSLARHHVRLVLGGSFQDLFTFVQALEEMPLTVWIDRLQLQSLSQDGEALTCELSLTVFTDNQGISD